MAATDVLALSAMLCAGVGGYALTGAWCARGRRAKGFEPTSLGARSRIEWLLRHGCTPLRPLAQRLVGVPALQRATADLTAMAVRALRSDGAEDAPPLDAVTLLSLVLGGGLLLGTLVGVLTTSVVAGMAITVGGMLALFAQARASEEKRGETLREEVPEALRSMGVCFRSGFSLLQTMKQVAHELDGSLGGLFDTAARRLEMGSTTTEALAVFDTARQVPELKFIAVALDAQHQSGGSIATVLESAQESVESDLELRRSLRVQTAQAKLSARIVTLMPFLLVALFSLMSPGFLEPFFASFAGMGLLGLALGMQIAGTLMVHRMLKTNAE